MTVLDAQFFLSTIMDSSDDEVILICAAASVLLKAQNKRKRKWWVKPWIERRMIHGAYHALLLEHEGEDAQSFSNFSRMDLDHFEKLYAMIAPILHKESTVLREAISTRERLALTLRFLASGDSYQSLHFLYRIGRSTIGQIIPETCLAITSVLKDKYMVVPKTAVEWEKVADDYNTKWNFPHCISAIDGKHVAIKAPPNSGSVYYNYKDFHSIILLAVVDAHYKFLWYEIGANGRKNDAGVYGSSEFSQALENNTLNFPEPTPIREASSIKVPFVLVGDDSFPLKETLLKPYPQRGLSIQEIIFNYRLSRARQVAENAFGILVNRFRVLSHSMNLDPIVATHVTECCVGLHNFLRTEQDLNYNKDLDNQPINWGASSQTFFTGNHSTNKAREIREEMKEYFLNEGQVPFQWQHLHGRPIQ